MPTDIISLLIATAGIAIPLGFLVYQIYFLVNWRLALPEQPTVSYQQRMKRLLADLARSSAEVDKTLHEMEEVSHLREGALTRLEIQLETLTKREKELQTRVESLQNVSLPAVQYFMENMQKGEKRSALRDYFLFVLGVIASTVIAIILKLVLGI